MATNQSTIDYIQEQISSAGMIRARKMFGEYCLYCDEKVVALVCDNELFVKVTSAGEKFLGECEKKPAFPGARPSLYISGDQWEDGEWLSELIRITADELPMPKPKVTTHPLNVRVSKNVQF